MAHRRQSRSAVSKQASQPAATHNTNCSMLHPTGGEQQTKTAQSGGPPFSSSAKLAKQRKPHACVPRSVSICCCRHPPPGYLCRLFVLALWSLKKGNKILKSASSMRRQLCSCAAATVQPVCMGPLGDGKMTIRSPWKLAWVARAQSPNKAANVSGESQERVKWFLHASNDFFFSFAAFFVSPRARGTPHHLSYTAARPGGTVLGLETHMLRNVA